MAMKNKVIKHLKGDIKDFKKEAAEDRKLIKDIKKHKHEKGSKHEKHESKREEKAEHKKKHDPKHKKAGKGKSKIAKVMTEFKEHKLHSGSKYGPIVHSKKQGLAIALSEARKAGASIKKPKSKKK